MTAYIPAEQMSGVLDRVADEVLAEADVLAPPVDALRVAAQMGMIVARDAGDLHVRARYVRLAAPAIFLADDPRPERRHYLALPPRGSRRVLADAYGTAKLRPTRC